MINGRTRLHVVANGTMTGQRYIDEVLLPHVRLFRGAVGDKFVFMDDNATCHRTLAVQDCLDSKGCQRLVWPARSPDLNPIENVWDALGRQVAGRNYPPTNKNTLIRALTEKWDKLHQQLLDNVVQRKNTVQENNGLISVIWTLLHHQQWLRGGIDLKRGLTDTNDAECSGHLYSTVVPENIKKVLKIILSDSKLKLSERSEDLKGKKFRSKEEVNTEIEAYFESKDKPFYEKGIKILEEHKAKCIALE
ncbi:uncharacterized protein TNCV_1075671 [Trichonephila clavipes]|uniref:Tc1-like transposase DDE domain-containing protein n=1 Tax=Trichonephila clavipes TaxID=2585209 RepID=A0A8X6SYH7_TRICX|nr:uncharacterized protein TNCV_1075671 [Trichonephila clavipes]